MKKSAKPKPSVGAKKSGATKKAAPSAAAFREVVDGFAALAAELQARGQKVERFAIGKPAPASAIAKAEKKRGMPVPAALQTFWSVCDGFVFQADPDGGGETMTSGVHVLQHELVSTAETARMGDLEGNTWFEGDGGDTDSLDGPRRNFLKVDVPQAELCWGYVLGDGDADPPLVRFDDEDMRPTKLTLLQYLEKSLAEARKVAKRSEAQARSVKAADAGGKLLRTKEIVALEKEIAKGTRADGEGYAFASATWRVLLRSEARILLDMLFKSDGQTADELFSKASLSREEIIEHLGMQGPPGVDILLPARITRPAMMNFLGQLEVGRLITRKVVEGQTRYTLNVTKAVREAATGNPNGLARAIRAMRDEQASSIATLGKWPKWILR